jgi:hypothetical protein
MPDAEQPIRAAELVGALSMATDLGTGQPLVREAGTVERDAVVAALDHAKIAVGPGGPAEMVPGQHHVRMNMYIAQVRDGAIRTVKSLGVVNPDEKVVMPV